MSEFDAPASAAIDFEVIPPAPAGFRSGFVGIVGRPNVGKSTLMNQLVGQKIAITSPIAQTTRNRLRGILTTPAAQLIFVDTPGIHKPHHQLGEVLVKNARLAIASVDVVLFVVDSAVEAGGGDRFIADLLKEAEIPIILGMNKADQQPLLDKQIVDRQQQSEPGELAPDLPQPEAAEHAPEGVSTYACSPPFAGDFQHPFDQTYWDLANENGWTIAKFSALTGAGLEPLLTLLMEQLEPGPYYYPPDLVTDQPERFIMGELIREQILLHTREEVPHSVAVVVEKVDETPELTAVLATIYVERDSQKGIIIGKKGSMLKTIGSAARQQMQKLIAGNVYLELFVKVQPKWRQSRNLLRDFGYRVEE